MFHVESISASYGQAVALQDVSLSVETGGILAVIGANGAGKTTLLKAIAGQVRVTSGRILLDGKEIIGLPAYARARLGVSLVPEGRRLFSSLTVEENLKTALSTRRSGPFTLATIYELMPLVAERRSRIAGDLSGGEQQATAIARALLANPRLLLLDEVSLGLAPAVVQSIYGFIPLIRDAGTTVLLVEQDVSQALRASRDVHCLLQGKTSLAGTDLSNAQITRAYFGA